MKIRETEICLIGRAVYLSQGLEFALYGIAAHAAHTDAAKKDRHFRDLNPEKFLRGDLAEQKATLGRIVKVFGDAFLIDSVELDGLIDARNLIVHNYHRVFVNPPKGIERRADGEELLLDFIRRTIYFTKVVQGLVYRLMEAAAKREGRSDEFVRTDDVNDAIAVYEQHASKHIRDKTATIHPLAHPATGN